MTWEEVFDLRLEQLVEELKNQLWYSNGVWNECINFETYTEIFECIVLDTFEEFDDLPDMTDEDEKLFEKYKKNVLETCKWWEKCCRKFDIKHQYEYGIDDYFERFWSA